MAGPLASSACDTTTTFSVPTVVGAGADSAFASPASPRLHPANVTAATAIATAIEPERTRCRWMFGCIGVLLPYCGCPGAETLADWPARGSCCGCCGCCCCIEPAPLPVAGRV